MLGYCPGTSYGYADNNANSTPLSCAQLYMPVVALPDISFRSVEEKGVLLSVKHVWDPSRPALDTEKVTL